MVGGPGPGVTQVWVGSSSSVFKVVLGSLGLPRLHHPASVFPSANWEHRPLGHEACPKGGRMLGGDQPMGVFSSFRDPPHTHGLLSSPTRGLRRGGQWGRVDTEPPEGLGEDRV